MSASLEEPECRQGGCWILATPSDIIAYLFYAAVTVVNTTTGMPYVTVTHATLIMILQFHSKMLLHAPNK